MPGDAVEPSASVEASPAVDYVYRAYELYPLADAYPPVREPINSTYLQEVEIRPQVPFIVPLIDPGSSHLAWRTLKKQFHSHLATHLFQFKDQHHSPRIKTPEGVRLSGTKNKGIITSSQINYFYKPDSVSSVDPEP